MSKIQSVIAPVFSNVSQSSAVSQKKKDAEKEDLPFLARQASDLNQDDFAYTYCISVGTLRAHEQKKRKPTEVFQIYYKHIKQFPVEIAELVTQVPDKQVSRTGTPMYYKLITRFPKEMAKLTKQLSD